MNKCAICGKDFPALTAGAYVSYSLALCSEECRRVYIAKMAKNPWEPEVKKPLEQSPVKGCRHALVKKRFMPIMSEWWTSCANCGLILKREVEG